MTDTKKNNFTQTNEALLSLSSALADLNISWNNKQNSFDNELKLKQEDVSSANKKLDGLKASTVKSIENIDNIINKLNIVLEKNGSSNNND